MKVKKATKAINCATYEIIAGEVLDVIEWLEQLTLPALIVRGDFGVLVETERDRNQLDFGLRFGAELLEQRLRITTEN